MAQKRPSRARARTATAEPRGRPHPRPTRRPPSRRPPTAIGWSLRHEGPPWEALEELRRLGYCEVTRDQDMVEVDFTELGRRLYV
ncbi:hypothetical protein [Mycolicibacterium mageritense]|uniref:hypothetical protein n=1 Tax=Mycolicibacterium mageritense TaxID=53462 RepID=UPI001E5841F9|nr:hypothetical protein [Mycolicibacterium mageritense]